ncbi:MAG: hypothetical protein IPN15_16595 [Saprospiraceae bacterium]|nr:hypothetical protein [Candidatus Vicinibacter affinis]
MSINPKFSSLSAMAWGTYIGSSSSDVFNDLELFSDGRVAFAGWGAGQLTEVNSAAGRSVGGDNDAVIGVLSNDGVTMNYLDELGGTGNDRMFDIERYGNTLYWTGAVSSGFPASASGVYDNTHNGGLDIIVGRVGDAGGVGNYKATFFGTATNDLGNGIKQVTQTSCGGGGSTTTFLMVWGTVNGAGLPTKNLNNESFLTIAIMGELICFLPVLRILWIH